jgi:hypothetical protein
MTEVDSDSRASSVMTDMQRVQSSNSGSNGELGLVR